MRKPDRQSPFRSNKAGLGRISVVAGLIFGLNQINDSRCMCSSCVDKGIISKSTGVFKGTHGVMSVKEISRRKPVNRSNWRGKALKEGEQSCSMSLA